jgi:hypothetical protein
MGAAVGVFPFLVIPILIYNLVAFGAPPEAASDMAAHLARPLFEIPMAAPGAAWSVSTGDLLVIFALFLFFAEILKSTSTGAATIANHAVSMLVFIICLIEFLLLARFSTSVFFVLTVMSLLDVLAGVIVTIISARRDFTVSDTPGGGR